MGMNVKQKVRIKIWQVNADIFCNWILLALIDYSVYPNQHTNAKRFKYWRYYLPKGIIDNCNIIINGKNFYDQPIYSDTKRSEEIRKLTTGQGEDHTTGCLLDYDHTKNDYRLITVDLSWQKELDADPKLIQQLENWTFKTNGQLKILNADNIVESMFVLTILENIKEKRLKFS